MTDDFVNYVGDFIVDIDSIQHRFGIFNGQIFAETRHKNLLWELNGKALGYGDLRNKDIARIQRELVEGEVFLGWNEHHKSVFQITTLPMVRITHDEIINNNDILNT